MTMLVGAYTAYVWSSYGIALLALAVLWIASARRRRDLNKTLALLDPRGGLKARKK